MVDLGWCTYFKMGQEKKLPSKRITTCGTTDYMCPEIVRNTLYDDKYDVWSIGVLAYELVSGAAPFSGSNDDVTKSNISLGTYKMKSYFSQSLKSFIQGILKKNPDSRPSMSQVINHSWLQNSERELLDISFLN